MELVWLRPSAPSRGAGGRTGGTSRRSEGLCAFLVGPHRSPNTAPSKSKIPTCRTGCWTGPVKTANLVAGGVVPEVRTAHLGRMRRELKTPARQARKTGSAGSTAGGLKSPRARMRCLGVGGPSHSDAEMGQRVRVVGPLEPLE